MANFEDYPGKWPTMVTAVDAMPKLASIDDFAGYPLTPDLIEAARNAVAGLRHAAEQLGQYTFEWDENDRKYYQKWYGRSYEAMRNADHICATFNYNIIHNRSRFPRTDYLT